MDNPDNQISHIDFVWQGYARCQENIIIVNKVREFFFYGITIEGSEIDLAVIMCLVSNKEFLLWLTYVNAEAKQMSGRYIFIPRYGDASKSTYKQILANPHIMYSACLAGPTTTLGKYYDGKLIQRKILN